MILSWLVYASSSSCKGTSGLLHIMESNTLIFVVLKAWHTSPLHYDINCEVFLHRFHSSDLKISNVSALLQDSL